MDSTFRGYLQLLHFFGCIFHIVTNSFAGLKHKILGCTKCFMTLSFFIVTTCTFSRQKSWQSCKNHYGQGEMHEKSMVSKSYIL